MTGSNVIGWIGSAEKYDLRSTRERPYHQDKDQFYFFHPPMPTENGKQLWEKFDERAKIEEEKFELKEAESNLVDKFDDLNTQLQEVEKRVVASSEDAEKKEEEIRSIKMEIKKISDELTKLRDKIDEVENRIDRVNEKINELVERVKKEEYESNKRRQVRDESDRKRIVDDLVNKYLDAA